MHQPLPPETHSQKHDNNELTNYKDLVINYLIRANSQVAHTLVHSQSTLDTLEAFHLAGMARAKTRKRTAYTRSALEDNSAAGVLMISAAIAGFQGAPFDEWLAWARMLAKSGLSIADQPLKHRYAPPQSTTGETIARKSTASRPTKAKPA